MNSRGRFDGDFGGGFGSGRGDPTRALEEARHQLEEQNRILERIKAGPTTRGYVVSVMGNGGAKALLSVSQQLVEVQLPTEEYAKKIDVGSCVRVQVDSLAILELLDGSDVTGDVATVRNEGTSGECEVDYHGNVRVVRYGGKKAPEAGDRVMVDATCNVVIRNLGADLSKFSFQGSTGISWDDIGGLHDAKADMQEAIELPSMYPELYRSYGKKPVRGVMLYGPAGCGKTLLAKAAATSMSKTHGASASLTGFIYVKGPELLDKFVGQTEAQIRSLFARGREHFRKHGYPAVLFIDEADAILGKRGARLNMGTETTVVPQFLSEMDGLNESGCIVLLATNRPDTLDPAVTRDGRIDRKVKVTRPTRDGAEEVFKLHLRGKPLTEKAEVFACRAADMIFDPKYELYEVVLKDKSTKSFTLGNLVNGAMIAGMIDNASTAAMRRDIKSGGKARGIALADFQHAVDKLFVQNQHTNHETELEEFCEPFEGEVEGFMKPKAKVATAEA